jgi:hypothetical protein
MKPEEEDTLIKPGKSSRAEVFHGSGGKGCSRGLCLGKQILTGPR